MDTARAAPFERQFREGGTAPAVRAVPVETPVALEFNGIAYAVMMATPADLADFVTGFARAERLIATAWDIDAPQVAPVTRGVILRANLSDPAPVFARARQRVSDSSCGLCGIESLAAATQPLPPVARPLSLAPTAIFTALAALGEAQTLGRRTAGTHAAALVQPDGRLTLTREDVGRHNALDKAIGARLRAFDDAPCFALVTSRASYELVEKTVLAGLGALVTVSAPTTLAIDRAHEVGLPLFVLARHDSVLRMT